MNLLIMTAALWLAAPLDDLKAIKPLAVPTYTWPVPAEHLKADNAELIELTRIFGAIGGLAEDGKERHAVALQVAQKAEMARGKPVVLAVTFRPWLTACDPLTDACWTEFGRTYQNWGHVADALAASTYRPGLVCLVDTETMDARTEPQRGKVAALYAAYDAFLRAVTRCTDTFWYSFAPTPASSLPDGWAVPSWSVPFAGQTNVGFEVYLLGELHARREASWRARAQADAQGVPSIVAWIAAPGCGRVYNFEPFTLWSWSAAQTIAYDAELGRELYGSWFRAAARERRFMAPASAVICYPHPLDNRIEDPSRLRLLAFIKGATE